MKFRVELDGLGEGLRQRHADTIDLETRRLMSLLSDEFKGYRCEVHGYQAEIVICFGTNVHSGVIAGYRLEGCCENFIADIYRVHFREQPVGGVSWARRRGSACVK